MKKILSLLIVLAVFITMPMKAYAAFGVGWNATSTTQGWIQPNLVNGVLQTVVAKNYIGTSTVATSTLAGPLLVGNGATYPYLGVFPSNQPPSYGYFSNSIGDFGGSRNDYIGLNVFNNSSGNCADAEIDINGDGATLTSNFTSLMHTSTGYTGIGCPTTGLTGAQRNSTVLWDPNGSMQFMLASSSNAFMGWYTGGYAIANEKLRLTNGGNFGISTTSPLARLAVVGTAAAGATTVFTTTGSTGFPGLTVLDDGKVGIKRQVPITDLHVSHGAAGANTTGIRIDNTSGALPWIIDVGMNGINETSFSLRDVNAGTWPFVIAQSSGRLGLGTTTPLALFHGTSSNAPKFLFDGSGVSNQSHLSINPSTSVPGNVGVYWSSSADGTNTKGQLTFEPQVYGNRGSNAGASPIITFNANTSNIGVGTTTPRSGSQLEAYAASALTTLTTYSSPSIAVTNSNTTANNFASLAFNQINTTTGSNINSAKISAVFTDHTAGSEDADLAFLTIAAGTLSEKMRITEDGMLGIGTTTPTQRISSVDNISWGANNEGLLTWATGSASVRATTGRDLRLQSNNGNSEMILTSAGNVGIGTSTPNTQLTVNGAGQTTSAMDTENPAGLGGTIKLQDSGAGVGNGGAACFGLRSGTAQKTFTCIKGLGTNAGGNSIGDLAFSTRNATGDTTLTERMIIKAAGFVGIGTSTPWRTLSVTGTMAISGLTTAAGTPSSVCMNATTFEVTVNAALTCTVSARDMKNSIAPLNISGIDTIMSLKPSMFKYNDQDRLRYGFIADELQAVDHQLADGYNTKGKPADEARSIDQPALIATLVKAVQEQQKQIEGLKKEIKSLKK